MAEYFKVAKVADLAPGHGASVVANGKNIAVFNVNGSFYAIDGTCVHRGGPLGEGELNGTVVTCPWHRWTYDVTTGAGVLNPAAKVACYETKVESEDILVCL
ncbi:MAG: Rieske (2Fe-2S) protein [Terriglobia bacterium]